MNVAPTKRPLRTTDAAGVDESRFAGKSLREMINAACVSQAVALDLINSKAPFRPISFRSFKAYLANKESKTYTKAPDWIMQQMPVVLAEHIRKYGDLEDALVTRRVMNREAAKAQKPAKDASKSGKGKKVTPAAPAKKRSKS